MHENCFQCTSCGFIYFHNAAAAVGAIITTPLGILLVRRTHEPAAGLLDTPGGFVDYGERLESALEREIYEELNIHIDGLEYLSSFPNTYIYESVTYFTTDIFFLCHYNGTISPVPNEEISEIVYINDLGTFSTENMAFESGKKVLELLKSRT